MKSWIQNKAALPFWLITFALIIGLVLPVLIQDGMFADGLFYTVVSKNMANGQGSFWFPYYSLSGFNGLKNFHEHPPLVFWIQSHFFRMLGNSIYTERIYTFFTLIVTTLLIHATWKKAVGPEEKNSGWLPLLLWIITPLAFWSFSNNMQENTMGIFVLLSVCFYLSAGPARLLTSGLCIFLASFSKGIPGLFPLSLPFLYWLCLDKISLKKMLGETVLLLCTVAGIYALLLLSADARESLYTYFFRRLLYRVQTQPTVETHFWILYRLFIDLAPALAVTLVLLLVLKMRKNYTISSEKKRMALFFILTGMAGTAPLMLTMVQRGFYFVPALPFFALGLAMLISEPLTAFVQQLRIKTRSVLTIIGTLLILSSVILTCVSFGKTKCNREMLSDIYLMGPVLRPGTVIGVPHEMWNEWSFGAYTLRHFNVDMMEGEDHPYYVIPKNSSAQVPAGFIKFELSTVKYDLYQRKN